MAVAGGQRRPHQLPMRGLVGRLELYQPLPLPTVTQHVQVADPVTTDAAPGSTPRRGTREAGHPSTTRPPSATLRHRARERGLDGALEPLDVDVDRPPGEERDLPSSQHDRVVRVEGPTGVVRRLAQVRSSGVHVEVRPERLDHLIACQRTPICERQQLHQLRGAGRRPRGGALHPLITHDHFEAAEQPDGDRRVLRSSLHRLNLVDVIAIVATHPHMSCPGRTTVTTRRAGRPGDPVPAKP